MLRNNLNRDVYALQQLWYLSFMYPLHDHYPLGKPGDERRMSADDNSSHKKLRTGTGIDDRRAKYESATAQSQTMPNKQTRVIGTRRFGLKSFDCRRRPLVLSNWRRGSI